MRHQIQSDPAPEFKWAALTPACELAFDRLRHAAHRLAALAYDLRFRPDQARIPAGQEGGGQWTNDDVTLISSRPRPLSVPVRVGGRTLEATPGQAARLAAANARAGQAFEVAE